MHKNILESQLVRIEAQLALLSGALQQRDPDALLQASTSLQTLLVQLSKVIPAAAACIKSAPDMQWRVKKLALGLSALRQGLLRQGVVVDRALATLMPAAQETTYTPKAGVYARQTYGSAGRQSGEFRAVAA